MMGMMVWSGTLHTDQQSLALNTGTLYFNDDAMWYCIKRRHIIEAPS